MTNDQQLPRNVKILGLASLLNDIASEMVFPLLPTFLISVLNGTKTSLGLIEGFADSVSSLCGSSPGLGPIASARARDL